MEALQEPRAQSRKRQGHRVTTVLTGREDRGCATWIRATRWQQSGPGARAPPPPFACIALTGRALACAAGPYLDQSTVGSQLRGATRGRGARWPDRWPEPGRQHAFRLGRKRWPVQGIEDIRASEMSAHACLLWQHAKVHSIGVEPTATPSSSDIRNQSQSTLLIINNHCIVAPVQGMQAKAPCEGVAALQRTASARVKCDAWVYPNYAQRYDALIPSGNSADLPWVLRPQLQESQGVSFHPAPTKFMSSNSS